MGQINPWGPNFFRILNFQSAHFQQVLPFKLQVNIHVMSWKEESGRFVFHFREVFEKCIEHIGKFLIHFREF